MNVVFDGVGFLKVLQKGQRRWVGLWAEWASSRLWNWMYSPWDMIGGASSPTCCIVLGQRYLRGEEHLGAPDLLQQRKDGLGKSNKELSVGKPHAVLTNVVDFRSDIPKNFERQIDERVAVVDWWHPWIPS